MLKKTIEFVDFNGERVSETHYFNLTEAEIVELEMSHEGGMTRWLQSIAEAKDGATIIREMKKIILTSYGKKSPDGRRFVKNQQLRDDFESSGAYSALFIELVTNVDSAIAFSNGLKPTTIDATVAKIAAVPDPDDEDDTEEPRHISRAEFVAMSGDDVASLARDIASRRVIIDDDILGDAPEAS